MEIDTLNRSVFNPLSNISSNHQRINTIFLLTMELIIPGIQQAMRLYYFLFPFLPSLTLFSQQENYRPEQYNTRDAWSHE